tara:strand:+ start:711 stop:968 length:258 start_codon:yes stop_codon:yes gene_type:complete
MIKFSILIILLVIAASVYYFKFYKKEKINDRDDNYIPNEVEDTIADVKKHATEIKRVTQTIKKDFKDVVDTVDGKLIKHAPREKK